MTDHTVMIKGATHYEDKEEKGSFFHSEIAHGEFSRTLVLPADVDVDHARPTFRNGLLEVIVPKQEKIKRKITINEYHLALNGLIRINVRHFCLR